jgi:translation initiation factor IF-2
MRVYEFAKEHGLTSKDLLSALRGAGFDVANHMVLLSPKEKEFLEKRFIQKEKKEQVIENTQQKAAQGKSMAQQPPVITPKREEKKIFMTEERGKDVTTGEVVVKPMTVGEFADVVKKPSGEIIVWLLKHGLLLNRNQMLPEKFMREFAEQHQIKAVEPVKEVQAHLVGQASRVIEGAGDRRAPIVVVIGHVDHGKTTLLDYIRKTRVASREKGGITQHLGAYEVETKHGKIIFLDTPGHEAFTSMRERGVRVADLAVLVVAADDGVMPQTVEAIGQARSVNLPIIVAINKVDKVDQRRIETVMTGLTKQGLVCEDWGGDTVCVPISAKEGTKVDSLLELVALQSELLELKTKDSGSGVGYILETKMEKGRGPVGTLILQQGRVRVGDYFVSGNVRGRINSIVDTFGKKLRDVGPTVPVQIAGFDSMAQAGDSFKVVSFVDYKKSKPEAVSVVSGPQLTASGQEAQGLKIVLKADTNSSKEAIVAAIQKLSQELNENIVVIQSGIGNVNGGDVDFAATFKAQVFGFGVKTEVGAQMEAQKTNTAIKTFYVIYHLLDSIKESLAKLKEPEYIEEKTGEAVVRKVFDIKGLGVIAGCYVRDGKVVQSGKVVITRDKRKVGEGTIKTLQRDRKSFKEVSSGFECAFLVDGFSAWQEEDVVECFVKKLVE